MNQQTHPFAPNPEEARNRARQAGIALPGDVGPAGVPQQQGQVLIAVDPTVGPIIGERHIFRVVADLYIESKVSLASEGVELSEPAEVLDMMKKASMEALALFDTFNQTIVDWSNAKDEAAAAVAAEVEAAKTPEEQATEGGVDLSHLAETPAEDAVPTPPVEEPVAAG